MKKNIKFIIIGIIIGGLLFTGVGVLASQIFARDVSYGNTNVESALDDLYSKANNNSVFSEFISIVDGSTQFDFANIKYHGFKKFKVENIWDNGASCSIKIVNTTNWLEENSPYSLNTEYDIPDSNRILLRASNGQCDFRLSLYK